MARWRSHSCDSSPAIPSESSTCCRISAYRQVCTLCDVFGASDALTSMTRKARLRPGRRCMRSGLHWPNDTPFGFRLQSS